MLPIVGSLLISVAASLGTKLVTSAARSLFAGKKPDATPGTTGLGKNSEATAGAAREAFPAVLKKAADGLPPATATAGPAHPPADGANRVGVAEGPWGLAGPTRPGESAAEVYRRLLVYGRDGEPSQLP
jgi:hypothetical protein